MTLLNCTFRRKFPYLRVVVGHCEAGMTQRLSNPTSRMNYFLFCNSCFYSRTQGRQREPRNPVLRNSVSHMMNLIPVEIKPPTQSLQSQACAPAL